MNDAEYQWDQQQWQVRWKRAIIFMTLCGISTIILGVALHHAEDKDMQLMYGISMGFFLLCTLISIGVRIRCESEIDDEH